MIATNGRKTPAYWNECGASGEAAKAS